MIFLEAWTIWKHQNWCVFDSEPPCLAAALLAAKLEATMWSMARAKGTSFLHALGPAG
uniref:Uncharacterized protein n=1 Tax=Arundo donax TaxID=35708 RepID=A0A0A9BML7_ARUDO